MERLFNSSRNGNWCCRIREIANWFKGVNLGHIQSGVNNLQRVLGVIQDLSSKDTKTTTPEYKPRPIYKHFDD